MDKKRKTDLPTSEAEKPGQYERTECRKTMRRTDTEELDILFKEADSRDKQPQDLSVKGADCSEGNVKTKTGLGTKRTKKPPKSLENFICRPTVRMFQRPGPVMGHSPARGRVRRSDKNKGSSQLHRSVQKKCNTDSVTKESSAIASTDQTTLSSSSLASSTIMSPASDSSNTTAKKVLPKQTKKTELKSDLTLVAPYNAIVSQSSTKRTASHIKNPTTSIKKTYFPKPAPSSPSASQKVSSPQEGISIFNEAIMQQDTASRNVSHENSNIASVYTVSYNENAVSPKPTSCLSNNVFHYNKGHLEMSSSPHLSRTEFEVCSDDSANSNNGDFSTIRNEKKKHHTQRTNTCANGLPDHFNSVSIQETDSSSTNKCAQDLTEKSKGKKGQNEAKEPNCTSEITIKSSKHSAVERNKDGSKSESDKHGKRVRDCLEQVEANCLADTSNTHVAAALVKPLMDGTSTELKQDKKPAKTQKVRRLVNKTAKMTNNHSPVSLMKGGPKKKTSCPGTSEVLSSVQCEQSKSKPSQNSIQISLLNKPQPRRRGRPKMIKLKAPLQGKKLQLSSINSLNNKHPQDPDTELDVKQPRPMARKRGRPKHAISVAAHETQPTLTEEHDVRNPHMSSNTKDIQICKKSKSLVMKTIIKKINKMRVKRKDQVLTQILLGQQQCHTGDLSQESSEIDLSGSVSPATDSLSSLVSSFGGKLGPQINISKRGTIYMGKRRGRKPKNHTNSNMAYDQFSSMHSQHISPDTSQFKVNSVSTQKSVDTQSGLSSGPSCSVKNASSSSSPGRSSQSKFSNQKVKAASFIEQRETQNSTFAYHSEDETNDNTTSDRGEKNGRVDEDTGFCSTGSVFTMSSGLGNRPKGFSFLPSERLFSTYSPVGSRRPQDSSEIHTSSPLPTLTEQEAQKFKCHRKVHHCLSREKFRRHKYKCKKKYMQLKAKRHDPDFLAEIEDLVVRLSKVRIVQHSTRTRSGDNDSNAGRKTLKGKSYDIQCLQEKVHPPAMFQINLSGYYSPHSPLSYEPLHYVRMRKKRGLSSEPSEQMVTHFPVMHKLGYPAEFIHPSYKVPLTSLGFGLYRGYPSATLYPVAFPPSYMHHYSKNPIISPSKFHKKRSKFARQDSVLWGQKSSGTIPKMMQHSSCCCFNTEGWQSEKQKEKSKGRREEHTRMTERQHGTEECQWCNNPPSDNRNVEDSSFTSPSSSSSLFSQIRTTDQTFPLTVPSNQRQVEEVRWSEHHAPWGLSNRNPTPEFKSRVNEDSLERPDADGNCVSPQQSQSKILSFLRQPKLFSNTQRRKRITKSGKGNHVSGDSHALMEQNGPTVQDDSSGDRRPAGPDPASRLQFPRKHQHSEFSSAREPEITQCEPRGQKTNKRRRIQDEADQTDQTSPDTHIGPSFSASTSGKPRHLKPSRQSKPKRMEMTAGNKVKKRGPGRPRKHPELTYPPSPPSTPELASCLTEEVDKAGKEDIDNRDTVLEVIELVIRGEERSPSKSNNARSEKDEDLKRNEEKDVVEEYADLHTDSAPLGPSPDKEGDSQYKESSASLPNKQYLWAGLYSDDYKTENIPDQPEKLNLDCLDYNPEEHQHGLLPAPLHVGKYLRLKRIDFRLPYDIHWLCAHNKLFENPVTPTEATSSNSSCTPPNSIVSQLSADGGLDTKLPDHENQARDTVSHTQLHDENQQCHQHLTQEEEHFDNENFPSPLSSDERSFVMKHGVFLVRNYEKMKARQAILLRAGVREQDIEKDEDKASEQSDLKGTEEDPDITSDRCQTEQRLCSEDEEHVTCQSRHLTQILQEIWDRVINCKGSSGQTLTDPLLNLCSRKRSDSALMDLSSIQRKLLSGHYKSLETFHSDMLIVFHCAEKYYGSDSAVGRDVTQLRAVYHRVHQEVSANFL